MGSTKKRVGEFLERTAKTFIIPSIYTQTAQSVEDIMGANQKQASGFKEQLIKDIPIARNSLNDKINALGDPIEVESYMFISGSKHDPVWDFIIRNKAWVVPVSQKQTTVNDPETLTKRLLTDDEYYIFAQKRGQKIRAAIEDILQNGSTLPGDEESTSASELRPDYVKGLLKGIKHDATEESKKEMFSVGAAEPVLFENDINSSLR